jgi:hypothetical protein
MKYILLLTMLLIATGCTSRTTLTPSINPGEKSAITDKKIIWIWQDDFYQ